MEKKENGESVQQEEYTELKNNYAMLDFKKSEQKKDEHLKFEKMRKEYMDFCKSRAKYLKKNIESYLSENKKKK